MLRESQLQYFDKLVDAYAAVCAFIERVEELETRISQAYIEVSHTQPDFDDLSAILGHAVPAREQVIRKVAWTAQHALSGRAKCVGYKVVQQAGSKYMSPLIRQLEVEGLKSRLAPLENFSRAANKRAPNKRLDALVFDPKSNAVYPIKGCSLSQVRQKSLVVHRKSPHVSLFDPKPRIVTGVEVSTASAATLVYATMVLKSAFPAIEVKPIYFVVDDPGAGWHYQAYSLDGLVLQRLPEKFDPLNKLGEDFLSLDTFPVVANSLDCVREFGDIDSLSRLPQFPMSDALFRLPVDRAARCYMLLNELWKNQRKAPNRIRPMSASALAKQVTRGYGIYYPNDLRRHDLEDCLLRGGLIDRPAFEGNSFALTPRGIARLLLMKRWLAAPSDLEDDEDLRAHILSHVQRQAENWAAYWSGVKV